MAQRSFDEKLIVFFVTATSVKLAFVTETFPPEINGVAMTFGVISRELGQRGHDITTDSALRSRLRFAARAAVEPQSWEKVITRFETDLMQVIESSALPQPNTYASTAAT
ncbi:MAG: hypothetical protein ABIO94_09530 [Opitutaceae bacterium]